jgi:hypothetical protein
VNKKNENGSCLYDPKYFVSDFLASIFKTWAGSCSSLLCYFTQLTWYELENWFRKYRRYLSHCLLFFLTDVFLPTILVIKRRVCDFELRIWKDLEGSHQVVFLVLSNIQVFGWSNWRTEGNITRHLPRTERVLTAQTWHLWFLYMNHCSDEDMQDNYNAFGPAINWTSIRIRLYFERKFR